MTWLWGGFTVGNSDAQPLLLAALPAAVRHRRRGRAAHLSRCIASARTIRSASTSRGRRIRIPFHPYYTVKDIFGLTVFLIIYACFVFFAPNLLGEPDNYIPANPLETPTHIVPEWYFLPYYAILRSIPNKLPA